MARSTSLSAEQSRISVAKAAAEFFESHPEHSTYGSLKPGSILVIRWGLLDNCLMTVRLNDEEPVIFTDAMSSKETE